jgi:lipooligosaccharide transport system permease protein
MSLLWGYRVSPKLAFRVWQREVTLYRRIWPSTILSTLLDPILYLLALGFGLGAYLQQGFEGVSYLQFIAPGLVASSIMYAAAFEAAWNTYVRIFVERAYDGMLATPAELPDVVAGEYAWGATRAFIYSIVMLLVLAGFGLLQSWWALAVPLVAILAGFLFMAMGMTYSVRVKAMDQLTFMFTLGVTPMFLFSGIFFPLSGLPQWIQTVAWFSPLYHLVETVRALCLGRVDALILGGHVLWMLVATAIFWTLPTVALRKKLRT